MTYDNADEALLRQQIEKHFKERQKLWANFAAFVLINVLLWAIWAFSTPTNVTVLGQKMSQGFPWPLIVTLIWGISITSRFQRYYNKYGRGAERREEAVQREIERYRESHMYEKPKNDFDRPLDINDDGEIEEVYEGDPAGRKKRR